MEKFTLEQAFAIQNSHLQKWQKILKESVFKELQDYINIINIEIKSIENYNPYEVPRGIDLDDLIQNYMLGHKFGSRFNYYYMKKPNRENR